METITTLIQSFAYGCLILAAILTIVGLYCNEEDNQRLYRRFNHISKLISAVVYTRVYGLLRKQLAFDCKVSNFFLRTFYGHDLKNKSRIVSLSILYSLTGIYAYPVLSNLLFASVTLDWDVVLCLTLFMVGLGFAHSSRVPKTVVFIAVLLFSYDLYKEVEYLDSKGLFFLFLAEASLLTVGVYVNVFFINLIHESLTTAIDRSTHATTYRTIARLSFWCISVLLIPAGVMWIFDIFARGAGVFVDNRNYDYLINRSLTSLTLNMANLIAIILILFSTFTTLTVITTFQIVRKPLTNMLAYKLLDNKTVIFSTSLALASMGLSILAIIYAMK